MDRINNTVLIGLVDRMSVAMGEELRLVKGSAINGIAWKIEAKDGAKVLLFDATARGLFNRAHAFMSGYFAAQDKAAAASRTK